MYYVKIFVNVLESVYNMCITFLAHILYYKDKKSKSKKVRNKKKIKKEKRKKNRTEENKIKEKRRKQDDRLERRRKI